MKMNENKMDNDAKLLLIKKFSYFYLQINCVQKVHIYDLFGISVYRRFFDLLYSTRCNQSKIIMQSNYFSFIFFVDDFENYLMAVMTLEYQRKWQLTIKSKDQFHFEIVKFLKKIRRK